MAVTDPLWAEIAEIERALRARGDFLYLGWSISRRYAREELDEADAFRLFFTRVFEPPGEMCGTVYDESAACSFCGAGRTQISELVLDLRTAPRTDFATTLADEYVVSQRLAEIMVGENFGGIELKPVRDVRASERADTPRYQLKLTHRVPVAPQTRFGIDLVEPNPAERDRCPLGHVAGLNVLSEVFIPRTAMAHRDFAATRELVGKREGVLVPEPLLIISPRVRDVLTENRITGWDFEVARLV